LFWVSLGIQLLDSRCNGTIEHKAFENFKVLFKLYGKKIFVEFLDTSPFCGRIALPRKINFFLKLLWHVWDKGERNMKR
jgi:hypothetical protein